MSVMEAMRASRFLGERLPRRRQPKLAVIPGGARPAEDFPEDFPVTHPGKHVAATAPVRHSGPQSARNTGPQPTFTANPPRETAAMPAVPGDLPDLDGPPSQLPGEWAEPTPELLADLKDGLLNLPVDRAHKFITDRRELEFFRDVTKTVGWCGLHAERKPPARQRPRYTLENWYADAMRLVAEATDRARHEVFGHLTAFGEQEDRIRTAENAANGLGYPKAAA